MTVSPSHHRQSLLRKRRPWVAIGTSPGPCLPLPSGILLSLPPLLGAGVGCSVPPWSDASALDLRSVVPTSATIGGGCLCLQFASLWRTVAILAGRGQMVWWCQVFGCRQVRLGLTFHAELASSPGRCTVADPGGGPSPLPFCTPLFSTIVEWWFSLRNAGPGPQCPVLPAVPLDPSLRWVLAWALVGVDVSLSRPCRSDPHFCPLSLGWHWQVPRPKHLWHRLHGPRNNWIGMTSPSSVVQSGGRNWALGGPRKVTIHLPVGGLSLCTFSLSTVCHFFLLLLKKDNLLLTPKRNK